MIGLKIFSLDEDCGLLLGWLVLLHVGVHHGARGTVQVTLTPLRGLGRGRAPLARGVWARGHEVSVGLLGPGLRWGGHKGV